MKPPFCPVCCSHETEHLIEIGGLQYWKCDVCAARFLDPSQHPSAEVEYNQYTLHRNDPDDVRYRTFLSKLVDPLLAVLEGPSEGLDYGCGPGPALAAMMHEAGHSMSLHDPFFFPGREPLERTYDFLTSTETAEHFHNPAMEFDRIDRLVRPRGWIGIMTSFQTDDEKFADWHYRKDPTHVVFYRKETFQVIAAARGWSCTIPAPNIVLMQKSSHSVGKSSPISR
ncbi:class I SAM-dependent methyltransferase [Parvibaculum sp.]|uniref:class I SAM-dependent methyltransferase n=1 Tax=Parvibaculum sp. TaxID=2024848 RepID=UPI00391D540F